MAFQNSLDGKKKVKPIIRINTKNSQQRMCWTFDAHKGPELLLKKNRWDWAFTFKPSIKALRMPFFSGLMLTTGILFLAI